MRGSRSSSGLKEVWLDQPSLLTSDGMLRKSDPPRRLSRPPIRVWKNKPPKLRFKPGTYVKYKGQIYEIIFVYRHKPNTQEWIFALEERKSLGHPGENPDSIGDQLSAACEQMGAGADTPRVVYEIFRNSNDARYFFADIPFYGDRLHLQNKNMLKAEILSSGAIL